jgi:hypothetical protein
MDFTVKVIGGETLYFLKIGNTVDSQPSKQAEDMAKARFKEMKARTRRMAGLE